MCPKMEEPLRIFSVPWFVKSLQVHSGPENLKKSKPKKLVKSNTKSISRNYF